MDEDVGDARVRQLGLLIAVCLIAATMRTTITGVGPLLEQIAGDLGTTTVALGALASIPLLARAVVSPLAHDLSQRFGCCCGRCSCWSSARCGGHCRHRCSCPRCC